MLRIVLAPGWYFPDSVGGTEVYVAALADAFAAAGHDVAIAAPKAGLAAAVETTHDGHRVFRYPVSAQATRGEARGEVSPAGAAALVEWLGRNRPDIFHAQSLVPGLSLPQLQAAKDVGSRVIYTNHLPSIAFACARGTLLRWGTEPCDGVLDAVRCGACLLQQRGMPRVVAAAISRVQPRSLSQFALTWPGRLASGIALPAIVERNAARQAQLVGMVDRFVVLSESAAAIVRANGIPPSKLVVNRLGVSSQYEALPLPGPRRTGRPITIGYVGRYDWAKGLRQLRDAIKAVPDDALRFSFRGPINSDDERAVRSALASSLAGDRRVVFESATAVHDMPAALAQLDVLCAPSNGYENGPTVALEALAVGTPVIGTRIGAYPENLEDGIAGALVPVADTGALAVWFASIAKDATIVDRWRAGIKPVRTMRQCADDYLRMYADVMTEAVIDG